MLRWLFGRTPPEPLPAPTAEQLTARLEHVEDHYKRLERRFDKVQGEFSSYLREVRELLDELREYEHIEEEDNDEQEPAPSIRRTS